MIIRVLSFLIVTIFCLAFILIPEFIMYQLWGVIDPVGFWQSFALFAAFWFFGATISVLFLVVGITAWYHTVT